MVHSKKHQQQLAAERRKNQGPAIVKSNDDWPKRRYTGLTKISQPGSGTVASINYWDEALDEEHSTGKIDYFEYEESKKTADRFRDLNLSAIKALSTKEKRDYELYLKLKEKPFADWFDDPNLPLAIKEDVLRLFRLLEGHIQGRSRTILHYVCAVMICEFHDWSFDHKIIWKNFDPKRFYENVEVIWDVILRRGFTTFHSVIGRKVTLKKPG